MRIFICDDELPILNDLTNKIKKYMPREQVFSFSSEYELLGELKKTSCDVLFLDIDMPEMDGWEIAGQLNHMEHKPLLIFVTNHDELVYESLQYHPFGFIRKSFFDGEIEKVLKDCREELGSRDLRFHFRMENKDAALLLTDILYFEADGNYLLLFADSGTYRFRSTVTAVENTLSGHGFIRVHKGFLVNQMAVKMLGKDEVELTNGAKLPLGKSYAEAAKGQLLSYMRF